MTLRIHHMLAVPVLMHGLAAQQLLWQHPSPPSTTEYLEVMPFADYNGDGYRDLMEMVILHLATSQPLALQFRSGRDGAYLGGWTDTALLTARYAGDVNGDTLPDVALARTCCSFGFETLRIFSPLTNQVIWENNGPLNRGFGAAILGDLDVNGDGRSDIITITQSWQESTLYVYDSSGAMLYSHPYRPQNRIIISLSKVGDLDSDGGDDFVVGANDATDRGVMVVVSGRTGATIRESFGLLPGDRTSEHASNFGDLDGDGVNDYGAFAYWSSQSPMAVAYSGATGSLLRSWPVYGNSVVTGEDFDLDGIPDFAYGADYVVSPGLPAIYGSTRAVSGRDGTELWRVDNTSPQGGTINWMESSASLGVQPGNPYPVILWLDMYWFVQGTSSGRERAYMAAFDGQGPITGTACSSTSSIPRIGARQNTTGSRVTIAHAPPAALAWLNFALPHQTTFGGYPLPLDLGMFGLPGCNLYVPPVATHLCITGTTGIDRGYAAVDLPFQLTPASVGISLVAQWLVLDPPTLQYAATAKHQLRAQ